MSTLTEFRDAAVSGLAAALDVSVLPVGGAFDAAELRRHVTRTPCVLVSLVRVDSFDGFTNSWESGAVFAAYVVTRDLPEADRDEQAMDIVTDIVRLLASNPSFGTTARVVNPSSVVADNLYSGAVDSVAVALWSVSWSAMLVEEVVVPDPDPDPDAPESDPDTEV